MNSAVDRPARRGAAAEPALPAQAQRLLRQVFGLRKLRPGQGAVVARVLQGQPTLAVMPTGAGSW